MPRQPRLHYPGALYHVISRGNNRQPIFLSDSDYKFFVARLIRVQKKTQFRLFAYCLMPNHFHLLVEVGDIPLSKCMQRVLRGHTAYFNRIHRRKGHLFESRYKAIHCDRENYLLELVRYIHLNPVRAGLAANPSGWRWSGHAAYLRGDDSIVETGAVLSLFGAASAAARQKYADFVREGLLMGHRSDLYPKERAPYIGNDRFLLDVRRRHDELRARLTPKVARVRDLKTFVEDLCDEQGVTPAILAGKSRKKSLAKVRKELIKKAFAHGHRLSDIARAIGRSQPFVSKVLLN